ncbi:MAG: hypothetical protein RB191_18580 [Terriglobia bacterium]|nr:hypothetical protein [Terriglobia bacterium]
MSKKDFIALADMIRSANQYAAKCGQPVTFSDAAILALATFCHRQNSNFMSDRWLRYIAGECGKNGGAVKAA